MLPGVVSIPSLLQYFVMNLIIKNSKIDRDPLGTCSLASRANFTLLGVFCCHHFLEVCTEFSVNNFFLKGLYQVCTSLYKPCFPCNCCILWFDWMTVRHVHFEDSGWLLLLWKYSLIHYQHWNRSYPVVQEHRLQYAYLSVMSKFFHTYAFLHIGPQNLPRVEQPSERAQKQFCGAKLKTDWHRLHVISQERKMLWVYGVTSNHIPPGHAHCPTQNHTKRTNQDADLQEQLFSPFFLDSNIIALNRFLGWRMIVCARVSQKWQKSSPEIHTCASDFCFSTPYYCTANPPTDHS